MNLKQFASNISTSKDLDIKTVSKVTDTLQEATIDWINRINNSEAIIKDSREIFTALKENGEIPQNQKFLKLEFFDHELTSSNYTVKVIDTVNESYVIASRLENKAIPMRILAKKLSEDSRVRAVKEVKAVSYTPDSIVFEFGDIVPNSNTFIVNEVYFGKTQNLLHIEDKIRELRDTITPDQYGIFDTLPLVQDINALFEAQFGMDVFSLHLDPYPYANAWTFSIGVAFDVVIDQSIKANGISATQKDGFRFKPNNGLCVLCCLTSGLLNDRNITSEEMVAILLHEIGHNFQEFIDPSMKAYNNIYILNWYDQILAYSILNHLADWKAQAMRSNTNTQRVEDAVSPRSEKRRSKEYNDAKTYYDIAKIKFMFKQLVNVALLGIPGTVKALLMLPIAALETAFNKKKHEFFGRTGEMTADKFPTIYGYGPAQQSALTKFSYTDYGVDKFINNIPLLGAYFALQKIPARMIINIQDEHPSLVARIEDQIYTLENELKKKNMSPAIRKLIEKDLEQLKQNKKDITEAGKHLANSSSVENWWNRYLLGKLDKEEMQKVSDRLNKEMDAYIKKMKK